MSDSPVPSTPDWQLLADTLPQHVWTAAPEGGLTWVSQRAEAYAGRPRGALLGDGWQGLLHPADLGPTLDRWRRSLSTGETYEAEFRLLQGADRAFRWHLSRAVAVRDAGGAVVAWHGTNTDIDAYKRTDEVRLAEVERERAARAVADAERARLRELFEDAPVAISITRGPDHVIEIANRLSRQLVGGRREFLGRPAREAFPDLAGQGLFELLDRVYATGEPFTGTNVPVRWDPDGDGVPHDSVFSVSYQPIRDGEGRVDGIFSLSVPVTGE